LRGKIPFFVNGMACIQKRSDFVSAKNCVDFCGVERFARIIAFSNFKLIFCSNFAQETPRVPAGRSSSFAPKINHVILFLS
jgi:hypothetical protein